jgi:hypothetical protein
LATIGVFSSESDIVRTCSAILAILTCLVLWPPSNTEANDDTQNSVIEEVQDDSALEVHASAEIELRSDEGFDEPDTQSSTTTKTDLTLDFELSYTPIDWASANLALTWDNHDGFDFEEAFLTLGNKDVFPMSVSGGKMILAFGRYESSMVSDPVTLEIGETHAQALLFDLAREGLTASIFLYNGKTTHNDDSFALRSWGGNLNYLWTKDEFEFLLGTSWMENVEDSDGLRDNIDDELQNRVPGLATYSSLSVDQWALSFCYVAGLEHPKFVSEGEVEKWDRPEAWSVELDYSFTIMKEMEILTAISYGQSDGLADVVPEKRFGGTVTFIPNKYLSLAVEYLREYDYSESSGGTGDKANIYTLNLAAGF